MKNKAGSFSKYTTKTGERLWRYRFDADPVDGKRQVMSKQGFSTRGAASEALQKAIEDYKAGKAAPGHSGASSGSERDRGRLGPDLAS